jgi:type VI secretion system protein ImpA
MPSPPILDISALIAPIPGPDPAGSRLPEVLEKIKELRVEEDAAAYAADDPMRPQNPKRANWAGVIQLATETLTSKSKDLLLAAYLNEALLKVHSFAGLRDGLLLFRELVDRAWDRLLPSIEDGDIEVRAGPFNLLDDPVRGVRLPTSVRSIPIVITKDGSFCYLDRNSPDPTQPPPVSNEDWEKALKTVFGKTCKQTVEDLAQCLEILNRLTDTLRDRMGPQLAPGMTGLRPALEGCLFFLQQIIRKYVDVNVPASPAAAGATAPRPAGGQATVGQAVTSRTEAYRQLAQAAAVLRELEPHSPIPYLVQKAVELGSLPFPELIKALVRNADVLAELNREMGIKEGG